MAGRWRENSTVCPGALSVETDSWRIGSTGIGSPAEVALGVGIRRGLVEFARLRFHAPSAVTGAWNP
jgi:hypothetical protein